MPAGSWQYGILPEYQDKKIINIHFRDVDKAISPLYLTWKWLIFLVTKTNYYEYCNFF
jgi:hypothetical protein